MSNLHGRLWASMVSNAPGDRQLDDLLRLPVALRKHRTKD